MRTCHGLAEPLINFALRFAELAQYYREAVGDDARLFTIQRNGEYHGTTLDELHQLARDVERYKEESGNIEEED